MAHQYIVTEPDPALVKWRESNPEHPVLRDADAKWYVREERGGWSLGPYERNRPARFLDDVIEGSPAALFLLDREGIAVDVEIIGENDRFDRPAAQGNAAA